MRVVLTGASGFIGSAIVAELLDRGADVTVLQREESYPLRIAGKYSQITTLKHSSLLDSEMVNALKKQHPDIFIHCAWRGVGGSERNDAFQITTNVPATIHSVEVAVLTGCRQWIGLGSQAEYGNQNRPMGEDSPLRPTTVYGKAKMLAGIAALALCEASDIKGAWLRVFSTYGPGDSPNWFLPYVIQEFLAGRIPRLTKCEQLWDYLYVADAARAICSVANLETQGVFNLGSGTARPLREYIEEVRRHLKTNIEPLYGNLEYRPDQVMHLEADISKLSAEVRWKPITSLEEGIRATIEAEKQRTAFS